jgi:hypothetical protein
VNGSVSAAPLLTVSPTAAVQASGGAAIKQGARQMKSILFYLPLVDSHSQRQKGISGVNRHAHLLGGAA